jgi:hypothetical protein
VPKKEKVTTGDDGEGLTCGGQSKCLIQIFQPNQRQAGQFRKSAQRGERGGLVNEQLAEWFEAEPGQLAETDHLKNRRSHKGAPAKMTRKKSSLMYNLSENSAD